MARLQYPELDNPDVAISSSVFSLLQMGSTGITAAVRSVLLKESAAVSTAFARGAVRSLAVVGVVLDGISIALSSRVSLIKISNIWKFTFFPTIKYRMKTLASKSFKQSH